MSKVCSNLVRSIERLPPDADNQPSLDTEVFRTWHPHLVMLEKTWFLNLVKKYLIVGLYKEGFDDLGEEFLSAVQEPDSLGADLVNVAMLRLTKFIYESEDHSRKLVMVKQGLLNQFSLMQSEAIELPESSLEDIKKFLVLLSTLPLDDEMMQLSYELLSLVQLFMRTA